MELLTEMGTSYFYVQLVSDTAVDVIRDKSESYHD